VQALKVSVLILVGLAGACWIRSAVVDHPQGLDLQAATAKRDLTPSEIAKWKAIEAKAKAIGTAGTSGAELQAEYASLLSDVSELDSSIQRRWAKPQAPVRSVKVIRRKATVAHQALEIA